MAGIIQRIFNNSNRLVNNYTRVEPKRVLSEIHPYLLKGERVILALEAFRDYVVLTERRIIHVDKKNITALRKVYHTIPYNQISDFKVETNGLLDISNHLYIYKHSSSKAILDIRMAPNNDALNYVARVIASLTLMDN